MKHATLALDPPADEATPIEDLAAGAITLRGRELVVIATNPTEMVRSQRSLIVRMKQNVDDARAELSQHDFAIAEAKKARINSKPLDRLRRIAERRVVFYEKAVAALEAGYCIVPNFPGDTIAIRVSRDEPTQGPRIGSDSRGGAALYLENADILPAGEGRYVDPTPASKTRKISVKEKNWKGEEQDVIKVERTPTKFINTLGLPLEFMKPEVVALTGAAADRRIFDEIIISPGRTGTAGDPLVLGRIRDAHDWQARTITFLITWFIDAETL